MIVVVALDQMALPPLLTLIARTVQHTSMLRTAAWALSNLCGGTPPPPFSQVFLCFSFCQYFISFHFFLHIFFSSSSPLFILHRRLVPLQFVWVVSLLPFPLSFLFLLDFLLHYRLSNFESSGSNHPPFLQVFLSLLLVLPLPASPPPFPFPSPFPCPFPFPFFSLLFFFVYIYFSFISY